MINSRKYKIIFVCMGNICRSPSAEAVTRSLALKRGLPIEVDSAGTIGLHAGRSPDKRAQQAGARRGYSFAGIRARQVEAADFERFDLILAADRQNFEDLLACCPHPQRHKLKMILDFGNTGELEVPDPYYGGEQGFEYVLDLLEVACGALLDALEMPGRVVPR